MNGALALLAGVLASLSAAAPMDEAWIAGAWVLAAAAWASPWRRWPLVHLPAMALLGMALAAVPIARWESSVIALDGDGQRALLEGEVISIPERDGAFFRFDVEGVFVAGLATDARPRRVRLQWREFSHQPRVGERWRLLVRLGPRESTRNFAGLDTAWLAFRDGVHAHGRVLPSPLNAPLALATSSVHGVRARIAARIHESIADPDAAALASALSVGLTAGMSADQWRVFNATGTTHLVAISGLHVTLFAWLSFRAARFAWRWLPLRAIEREPFACILGLVAAGGYAWLAGFSVPTQRTWLMLAVYVVAKLAGRHVGGGRLWAMALIAVLAWDPLAPLSAGFWLSFVAVGVLLVAGDDVRSTPGRGWWVALRLQLAVMLALAPATFAVFGSMSVVGLIVNLVAIPVISLVFVPLVLAAALTSLVAPAAAAPLFSLVARFHDFAWPALVASADLPAAVWRAMPADAWYLVALPAVAIGLCRWPWGLRLSAAAAVLSLAFMAPDLPAPGEARVVVFDAGRGSAVWVRTRAHTLLFDTGDSWGTRGGRLRSIVLPHLDAMQSRVDTLVLPALDADRASGAALLAFERGAGRILVGGDWPGSRLATGRCDDDTWRWDGVEFQTFTAARGRQCVLRLRTPRASLLLPGDLDAAAERALIARLPAGALASDVVVVSRQVSATASSPEWIEATAASRAIAAGGVDGARSRHEVLERWRHAGARVVDTRCTGAVALAFGADGPVVDGTASGGYPFVWRRALRYSAGPCGKS